MTILVCHKVQIFFGDSILIVIHRFFLRINSLIYHYVVTEDLKFRHDVFEHKTITNDPETPFTLIIINEHSCECWENPNYLNLEGL